MPRKLRYYLTAWISLGASIFLIAVLYATQAPKTSPRANLGLTAHAQSWGDTPGEPCGLAVVICGEPDGERRLVRVSFYGWTGNPMANGKYPADGFVATSDRTLALGTHATIDGVGYIVGDYTAEWVHDRFGVTTFDIFRDLPEEDLIKLGSYRTVATIE